MQQIKNSELKVLRKQWHKEQGFICPILNQKIPHKDAVVDHKHRNKSTPVGKDGAGMIRGVIQRSANVIEGKLTNAYVRYGLHKFDITLPQFLRNLADYLELPPLAHKQLIHPSEAPPILKLKKSSYNKLIKAVGGRQKVPIFRDKFKNRHVQTLTKTLNRLFIKYDIVPEFYGKKDDT